jgi:hypothetical protein
VCLDTCKITGVKIVPRPPATAIVKYDLCHVEPVPGHLQQCRLGLHQNSGCCKNPCDHTVPDQARSKQEPSAIAAAAMCEIYIEGRALGITLTQPTGVAAGMCVKLHRRKVQATLTHLGCSESGTVAHYIHAGMCCVSVCSMACAVHNVQHGQLGVALGVP